MKTAKEIISSLENGTGITDQELIYLISLYGLIEQQTRKIDDFRLATKEAIREMHGLSLVYNSRNIKGSPYDLNYQLEVEKYETELRNFHSS